MFLEFLEFLGILGTDFDEFYSCFLQQSVINRQIFRPEVRLKDWHALGHHLVDHKYLDLPTSSRPNKCLDTHPSWSAYESDKTRCLYTTKNFENV